MNLNVPSKKTKFWALVFKFEYFGKQYPIIKSDKIQITTGIASPSTTVPKLLNI